MLRGFKVLFLYPSLHMQTGIPLSIACLSGAVKAAGGDTRMFDTFPYRFEGDGVAEHEFRAKVQHSTRSISYADKGVFASDEDPFTALSRILDEYSPDLIGMSAAESVWERGCLLTRHARALRPDIPIIAGGVFPTLAPEIAITEPSIDMICTGEGESALVEVCERVLAGRSCADVQGLWVKEGGKVVRNDRRMENMAELPMPDFHIFEKGTFLRPMQGHLFRTIPMEFSRGCPYKCTFCAEPALEKAFEDVGKKFFRKKDMEQIIQELRVYAREYDPEFFYFSSETFLTLSTAEFDRFIEEYREIGLPFWIQTRPETLSREKIRRLKEVGLFWMSIGVEHGDDGFRSTILKRRTSNQVLFDAVDALGECGQGASLNFIVGFPFETPDLVRQSIKAARELYRRNPACRCNLFGFTPFRGSELYDICVANGFWDGSIPWVTETDVTASAMIDNPQLSPDQVKGLMRTFPLYVYLPDEYQARIPLAETATPEGDAEYQVLNEILTGLLPNAPLPLPPRPAAVPAR